MNIIVEASNHKRAAMALVTVPLMAMLVMSPFVSQASGALQILASINLPESTQADVSVHKGSNRIYITNSLDNSVSVIRGTDNTLITTRDLTPDGCENPVALVTNQVGNRVYIACQDSNNVLAFNAGNGNFLGSVESIDVPFDMGINPDTNRLYVTNFILGSLTVIDSTNGAIVATIPLSGNPTQAAVHTGLNKVFVATLDHVFVIDGATNTVIETIDQNITSGFGIDLDPITGKVFVTNFQHGDGYVTVIDASTHAIIDEIQLGDMDQPYYISIDTDNNWVMVGNQMGNKLTVINGNTHNVVRELSPPEGSLFSMIGLEAVGSVKRLYVAISNNETNLTILKVVDYTNP